MYWRSKEYAVEYAGQRSRGKKDPSKDEFLSKYLPVVPSIILDAGGGSGRWSLGFSEMGHDVCLVDFNPHMLRMAKQTLKGTDANIVLADICFLPFRSEIFDFVFCEADPISQGSKEGAVSAVESLFDVLKSGSIMVGSLSNRYFWLIKMLTEAKDENDLEEVTHLLDTGLFAPRIGAPMYLFVPDEFVEETKKTGFLMLELVPYSGLIASQFVGKDTSRSSGFFQKINKIEEQLAKKKETAYFSRRFRFAVQRPR